MNAANRKDVRWIDEPLYDSRGYPFRAHVVVILEYDGKTSTTISKMCSLSNTELVTLAKVLYQHTRIPVSWWALENGYFVAYYIE